MPFDWLHPDIPEAVRARGGAARRRVAEEEIQERAALLARLGYDEETILRRLRGDDAWAHDVAGTPALDAAALASVATAAVQRARPRS